LSTWRVRRAPQARRRRWEEVGWLCRDSAQLAVSLPDGTLAGIVGWRTIKAGGPDGGCGPAGMSASRREITRNG
jgi:hypothetical protein